MMMGESMKKILALLALMSAVTAIADSNLICSRICKYDMDCMDRCMDLAPASQVMTEPTPDDDDDSASNSGNPDDTGSDFGGSTNTGSWEDYSGAVYY